MAHFWRPSLLDCMTIPLRTLKCPLQSLQRYGIGFRFLMVLYRTEPQSGQQMPLGQRCASNHASAAWSSGNSWNSFNKAYALSLASSWVVLPLSHG